MLSDFIEKLRQQPEHKKRLVLWSSTAIIMLAVLSVWLFLQIKQPSAFFNAPHPAPIATSSPSKSSANFFEEFSGFLTKTRENFTTMEEKLSKTMGDFFSGKNGPQETSSSLDNSLSQPQNSAPNPTVALPLDD